MADALLEAIQNDDCTDLEQKLANCSSSEGGVTGRNNPLVTACKHGSINCAKEIIRLKPELAEVTNEDGLMAIHWVCKNGEFAIFMKVMVEQCPRLCDLKDIQGKIALHIAAENGNEEVLRTLVSSCPTSLGNLTYKRETVLHLALKNDQCGSFKVLMNELENHKREELLNSKDCEGNTVLHIATCRKQIEILRLLLCNNSTSAFLQVNSTNGMGFTALDLHYQNHSLRNDKDITDLLHQAGAKQGQQSLEITYKMIQESMSSMTSSVLLTVFIFVAGAAYASLFTLNDIYPILDHRPFEIGTLSVKDMITVPSPLQEIFFFMVFNTLTFMGSMVVILVNTWFLISKGSFCFKAVLLLVMVAMSLSYALIMKKIMPEFSIAIGILKISSFWVVWLFELPLFLSIVVIWLIVKQILCIFSKLSQKVSVIWKSSNNQ
ncbi:hypothetical protein F0562_026436 [Nyssa sinensis]|uniref:Uncharacterized protein n=1 Tax=Nyssa sinensis TaxID=561372 RepID=A0A5J5BAS3_9ASTE|nr:hypothetical protein F0562_026436 [Nyssa sinensis]